MILSVYIKATAAAKKIKETNKHSSRMRTTRSSSHGGSPPCITPPGTMHPPRTMHPPGLCTPPKTMQPPTMHPLWTDTPVNILPCSKLLRAVTTMHSSRMRTVRCSDRHWEERVSVCLGGVCRGEGEVCQGWADTSPCGQNDRHRFYF